MGLPDMTKNVAGAVSNFTMVDVMKIGGITGWLDATTLAEALGCPSPSSPK